MTSDEQTIDGFVRAPDDAQVLDIEVRWCPECGAIKNAGDMHLESCSRRPDRGASDE